jgi:hypothetical protein
MQAGQSKLKINQVVKIVGFTGNDAVYNGLFATVTNPFATGCCEPGWVGLCMQADTVYGRQINAHENELEVITPRYQVEYNLKKDGSWIAEPFERQEDADNRVLELAGFGYNPRKRRYFQKMQ